MPIGNVNMPGANLLVPLTIEELKQPPNYPGAVKIDYPPDTFNPSNPPKEEKKGGFLGKVVKTIAALGAVAAGLIYAKRTGKLDVALKTVKAKLGTTIKTRTFNKYIKNPLVAVSKKLDSLYTVAAGKIQEGWTVLASKLKSPEIKETLSDTADAIVQ